MFLHDALLEALECGVTEVTARELANQYKRLCTVDPNLRINRLELEFNKLASTIHQQNTRANAAMPSNKTKNRYHDQDTLPCKTPPLHTGCYMTALHFITDDKNRVRLLSIPGLPGSDYINGTHIDVSSSARPSLPATYYHTHTNLP